MQFFKKKAKSSSRVGLVVSSDQLAVAHMGERNGAPYRIACERVALQSEKDADKALAKIVKTMEVEGKQCSYVLNRKDYNLHLVEAPEVEDSELRAAVRWKIKDLLDMKLGDAAIDAFKVPGDAYRGRGLLSGNLIFNRQDSGAPDGPFTTGTTEISIGLSAADSDTAAIKLDTNIGAPPDIEDDVALIGTEEFRYGRLRLLDSYAPETEPLGIGVLAEYWNGSEFILNTDDSCTTLPFSFTLLATARLLSVVPDSALAPLEGSPIATDDVAIEGGAGTDFKITLSGGETVANDIGSVDENDANEVLSDSDRPFIAGPPTGETVGSVILELDLDGIFDFLKYDWRGGVPEPGATALDILYDDVPEEASGEYNDNPRAIIEFGSYRGHDRVINWQEIYIGPTP